MDGEIDNVDEMEDIASMKNRGALYKINFK